MVLLGVVRFILAVGVSAVALEPAGFGHQKFICPGDVFTAPLSVAFVIAWLLFELGTAHVVKFDGGLYVSFDSPLVFPYVRWHS